MKYQTSEKITVSLKFANSPTVGHLLYRNNQAFFEYTPEFLSTNILISPFKLPLRPGVIPFEGKCFDGLFGVFNDSLPDGWGRLLIDRKIRSLGIDPSLITPIDRLTLIGNNGIGALSYRPTQVNNTIVNIIDLELFATESKKIMDGETKETLEALLSLNGPSCGARPKISVGVSKNKKKMIDISSRDSDDFTPWIIKFNSSYDPLDMGRIEFVYSLMARAAGIEMSETHLFIDDNNNHYFGIKRFDHSPDSRLHVHSASGLLHADHRYPALDYSDLLKATHLLTKNSLEVEKLFRLACFNLMTHNRDDHAKNFSFLMDSDGNWRLSPAYDLTFSNGPGGEHSTSFAGEGKNPGKDDLLKLANLSGMKESRVFDIIAEVSNAVNQWSTLAKNFGISNNSINNIISKLMPIA